VASVSDNTPLTGSSEGSKDSDRLLKDPVHDSDSEEGEDLDDMAGVRPPFHRPTDGRSQQPLLKDDRIGRASTTFRDSLEGQSSRPHMSRRSTFRSRTPDVQDKNLTRRKYVLASGFLLLSLVSFVIQTETAVYIQHELHWDKPYCML
jgi:hypothetical protein